MDDPVSHTASKENAPAHHSVPGRTPMPERAPETGTTELKTGPVAGQLYGQEAAQRPSATAQDLLPAAPSASQYALKAGGMRALWSPADAGFALLLVFVAVLYAESLGVMVRSWFVLSEYSHGIFVPVAAVWVLLAKRGFIVGERRPAPLAGAGFMVLGLAVHIAGVLTDVRFVSLVSMLGVLAGVALLRGGWPLLRVVRFPLLFLALAFPLPSFVEAQVTVPLQALATELGTVYLRLLGVSVHVSGAVIDLGRFQILVADACAGVRYLYPIFVLSMLASYLMQAPNWLRVFIPLSAVPVVLVFNGLRIAVLGLAVAYGGVGGLADSVHVLGGWSVFVLSLAALYLEMRVLVHLVVGARLLDIAQVPGVQAAAAAEVSTGPQFALSVAGAHAGLPATQPTAARAAAHIDAATTQQRLNGSPRTSYRHMTVGFLLCGLFLMVTQAVVGHWAVSVVGKSAVALPYRAPDYARPTFISFPKQIGGWVQAGRVTSGYPAGADNLDDVFLSDYRAPQENPAGLAQGPAVRAPYVTLYMGYNSGPVRAEEDIPMQISQLLPAPDWDVLWQHTAPNGAGTPPYTDVLVARGGKRLMVRYWFYQGGRQLNRPFRVKMYQFIDKLLKKRSSSGIIRLSTYLEKSGPEDMLLARERLDSFTTLLDRVVPPYMGTDGTKDFSHVGAVSQQGHNYGYAHMMTLKGQQQAWQNERPQARP